MRLYIPSLVPMVLVYALPFLVALSVYLRIAAIRGRRMRTAWTISRESGLSEPVSLHPVINPNRCLGCGACADACPESDVLGILGGQAELVNPTHCIGHGRCREACPTHAIELVLGTHTRGVEIPVLDAGFQTSVPGIFVAGELGGMGLIRNAIEQGRQAVEAIRKLPPGTGGDQLDLLIVGAGPAGFAASLAARQHGMSFATLEQDSFGGAIAHNPRGKIFVLEPVDLPLVGRIHLREMTKEKLLALWQRTRRDARLVIHERERVEKIVATGSGFDVRSTTRSHTARAVLLAVGRRGTPRRLDVPGEDSPHVVYRLVEPEQYRGKRVLVVGGGDSAVEAAVSLADVRGTRVTLCHRKADLDRPRPSNQAKVLAYEEKGRVEILRKTRVRAIGDTEVEVESDERTRSLEADAVVVCAGGVLPKDFLRAIGVHVETRYGTPLR